MMERHRFDISEKQWLRTAIPMALIQIASSWAEFQRELSLPCTWHMWTKSQRFLSKSINQRPVWQGDWKGSLEILDTALKLWV